MWRDVNPEQKQGFGPEQGCSGPAPSVASAARLCGKAAASAARHRAPRGLGRELCVSTECHLVGFHFISHISLKLYFLIKNVALCIGLMHAQEEKTN